MRIDWSKLPALAGERELRRCEALLTREDLIRSERFRVPEQGHRSLVGRALTRFALSRYRAVSPRAWKFSTSSHGRPLVEGSKVRGLSFNLSSTPGLVACAIAQGPGLGVDVEALVEARGRPTPLDLIDRLFTVAETEDIRSQPAGQRRERFLDFWTLKEAYLKACGVGLGFPLRSFGFCLGDRITLSPQSLPAGGEGVWQFGLLSPTRSHRAAVAVRSQQRAPLTIVPHWWHG